MCEYCENTFSNKRNKNIMEGELKTFTGVPLCKFRTYLDVNQFDNTPELKTDLFTYENYTEPENGTKLRELIISGGFQTIKYCPFCGEFLGRKTRTIVEFRENEKNLIRPATDEELDEIENDKNWIRCFNRAHQQVLPFIKRMEKCIDMARRDGRIYLDNIVDILGFPPIKDGYNGYDAYAYWEYEEFKNIICCLDGTLVLPQPHSLRPKNLREENSEKLKKLINSVFGVPEKEDTE